MKMQIALIFSVLLAATPATAMLDQTYGLGGTLTGKAIGTTDTANAFSALVNPALLATGQSRQFDFSFTGVRAGFEIDDEVLLDSKTYLTREGTDRRGTPELVRLSTSVWAAGYSHPVSLSFWPGHRMGFGLALSGPFEDLRRWMALSAYDFTNLRFGGPDIQFKGTLGTALEIIPKHLFLGAGLSIFMTSSGVSNVDLNTRSPTGRLAMNVGLNSALVMGMHAVYEQWGFSLVGRQAVNPKFRQEFTGTVRIDGSRVMNQPATIEASLYYEPAILSAEVKRTWGHFAFSGGVTYQNWARYEPRYLNVATRDADGRNYVTMPAITPMRDTLNPGFSIEYNGLRRMKFATSYQFRPTPVVDLSGPGNLLDTNQRVIGLSVSRDLGNVLFMERTVISMYGQHQMLEDRTVIKASSEYIGAPGYTIRGSSFAFGLSLAAGL